ncbi:hypothetical protein OPT61_g6703 [Boeremia exigua]|uniref:Uncharacterized protein n=1 Tax=Boeremia exigua TaxID=749465 RepID=A0ACC2I531_9PLEO|nr:hypothetical protein OPT61_g6703 [Boeremia exigua]
MSPSYSSLQAWQATPKSRSNTIPILTDLHRTPQLVEQDHICQTPVKLSVMGDCATDCSRNTGDPQFGDSALWLRPDSTPQQQRRVHVPCCATRGYKISHTLYRFLHQLVPYRQSGTRCARLQIEYAAIYLVAGVTTGIESVRCQDGDVHGGVDGRAPRGANDAFAIEHGTGRPVGFVFCASTP